MANPTRGVVTGGLIATVFGVVFVIADSGHVPGSVALVVRIAVLTAGACLVVVALRQFRPMPHAGTLGGDGVLLDRATADSAARAPCFSRGYWLIVLLEVSALFGGLRLLSAVWGWERFGVAWVATVVGVHFFGLGWLWRLARFHVLGAVIACLGIAGLVGAASGASVAAVEVISGIASGVVLLASTAWALLSD